MSTSSRSDDETEISEETSKRVCTHMNEDHAVSVYAMAKSLLGDSSSLTEATLTRVTNTACHIRAILCNGDVCEMRQLEYSLDPPLASPAQLRPRLVAIHHAVFQPKVSWLWTKPICRVILVLSVPILYATFGLGVDKVVNLMETHSNSWWSQCLLLVYRSPRNFAVALALAAWFIVIAHSLEALYVFYHAIKTLKLKQSSAMQWYALITCVGFPITGEFIDLLQVQQKTQAAKKQA